MWNLFGKYKGKKVLPSARQMNLIAAILNHVTQGTGIKMSMPQSPSTDAPWTIGVDTEWLRSFVNPGTSGSSATITVVSSVTWTSPNIVVKSRQLTYTNGLLTNVGNETTSNIATVAYSS